MNKLKLTGLSLLMLATGACSNDIKNPDEPLVICPITPTPEGSITDLTRSSINNINDFAIKLLEETESMFPGNVCLSPISVSAVLSMLANGDDGETRDEMLSLLGFGSGTQGLAELNFYNKVMLSNLPTLDAATTYNFTNSYWHDPDLTVREDFKATIADVMYASVYNRSPRGEEGRNAINNFVELNTNGLIKNFIEKPLDNITSAFLNTTYFKGEWSEKFEEELTAPGDFLNLDGSLSQIKFMYKSDIEYAETEDGTKAVRLPYGNGSFHMTAILPSDQINHIPLMECLNNDNLAKLDNSFHQEDRLLAFPKFESDNKADMLDVLKKMGVSKACDFYYGFNSIIESPNPLALVLFLHASKVIVDESGTEGAAASMGGLIDTASPDPEPLKPIIFNRPFIYLIRENTSGAILFIGAVTDFS